MPNEILYSLEVETATDPCKSDLAKSVANNRDADGKQTARLLRNVSLICSCLIYDRECANGTEKRHYLHLWAHLTRAMANEFYTKFLYQIHYDELIAGWIGEQHHKIAIICGFNFTPNSLGFDRLQPFLMRKHRGKCIVNWDKKLAMGPKVMGLVESSEAMHTVVSNGICHWIRRDKNAFRTVVEILRDLHIGIPGSKLPIFPRDSEQMGGQMRDGESIASYLERLDSEGNTFFFSRKP